MSNTISPGLEFTCCICGKVFTSNWTEEQAAEELKRNFGRERQPDDGICCDDCYNKWMKEIGN